MSDSFDTLSEREKEILRMVASGAPNKEIARQLVISPNTVKVHLRNIFAKIGVSSRTEATLYALRHQLVSPEMVRDSAEEAIGSPEIAADAGEQAPPAAVPEAVVVDRAQQPAQARAWRWVAPLILLALLAVVALLARQFLQGSAVPPTPTPGAVGVVTRWQSGQSLPAPRKGMGAGEYGGEFFLVGGQTEDGVDGVLLRYRPAAGRWDTLAAKPTPVSEVQAVVLGEKIYVPGGLLADGKTTALLEVYDPRSNTWEQKTSLPQPVRAYALAAYEGKMYLFGGRDDQNILDTVYVYTPEEDRWETRSPMPAPRALAGASVVGARILLIGGTDGQTALSLVEGYYPNREANQETAWERYADLPGGRYAMGVAHLAGIVYVLGGLSADDQIAEPAGLQYFAQSNQWAGFEAPPQPIGSYPAVLALDNSLYILGGETAQGLSARLQNYQAVYTISIPLIIEQ